MYTKVGYAYLKHKPDLSKILKYSFEEGASVGRVVSQIVKDILIKQKSSDKKLVYLIEKPGTLTFTSPKEYLINKYHLKYTVGHKAAGPFYTKTALGLVKLIVRTMMKYKGKHRLAYKKICIMEDPTDFEVQTVNIKCKSSRLSSTFTVSQLISSL